MTVRVERTMTVPVPPERVWNFITDPEKRARPISVVEDWDVEDDRHATWYLTLPIPLINSRLRVETEDVERRRPEYVRFVGRSKVMRVQGEHELEATADGGTKLTNRFVVEGRLPGVERFFERNLDTEMQNLEQALRDDIEVEA